MSQTLSQKLGHAWRSFWSAPDMVQKVGIVGAGVAVYPLVVWLIWIVWKGHWASSNQPQQLEILGRMSLGAMGLLALVIVALLGVVKGIKAELPGGASIDVDLKDDNNAEQHND